MARHFLIGVSGFSGSGKDTVTGRLIAKYKATQIGMTDPAKRHMADVYGFSESQLFGPSENRNRGDLRYPKNNFRELKLRPASLQDHARTVYEVQHTGSVIIKLDPNKEYFVCDDQHKSVSTLTYPYSCPGMYEDGGRLYYIEAGDPRFWLSPREALQKYCELMNSMYEDTWIRKSLEDHKLFAEVRNEDKQGFILKHQYHRMQGIGPLIAPDGEEDALWYSGHTLITCSADYRHWHEIGLMHKLADTYTPILIRVKRPSVPKPPYQHRSETEQATIPDSKFNFVLDNDGTITDLDAKVDAIVEQVIGSDATKRLVG